MINELFFTDRPPALASTQSLEAVEAELSLRLPAALAEFCLKWNGGFPDERNCFYPVPSSFEEFYKEYGPDGKGVVVDALLGVAQGFPKCSLMNEYARLRKVSRIDMIPIAFDLLGNHVVLQADSPGGPVFWRDHELWEAREQPRLIPIAQNLEFFYNSLTTNPF